MVYILGFSGVLLNGLVVAICAVHIIKSDRTFVGPAIGGIWMSLVALSVCVYILMDA